MRQRVKRREGTVVSAKMVKTVVVEVERQIQHPKYGKRMRRRERYKVHDEQGQCREGDRVQIIETRPLSKDKRWRVSAVVVRAAG